MLSMTVLPGCRKTKVPSLRRERGSWKKAKDRREGKRARIHRKCPCSVSFWGDWKRHPSEVPKPFSNFFNYRATQQKKAPLVKTRWIITRVLPTVDGRSHCDGFACESETKEIMFGSWWPNMKHDKNWRIILARLTSLKFLEIQRHSRTTKRHSPGEKYFLTTWKPFWKGRKRDKQFRIDLSKKKICNSNWKKTINTPKDGS